jgi:hypothetical protein
MGSYIPSYWDSQIRAALNGRFSDTTIPVSDPAHDPAHPGESFMGQKRRHHGHENMFDIRPGHRQSLERVAHRLAYSLGLGPVPTNDDARRRWYWLLNPASGILPSTTADKILNALAGAMAPGSGFTSIQFDLTYNTAQVLRYDLNVVDTGNVRKLTLISNQDAILPTPTSVQQPLNPPARGGETAINNVVIP